MDEMVMNMDHASRNELRQTSHRGRAAIRRTQDRYEVEMGHEALRFIARQRRPTSREIVHFLHRPETVLMLIADDDIRQLNLLHILKSYVRTGRQIPLWLLELLHTSGHHMVSLGFSVFDDFHGWVFDDQNSIDNRALTWMFDNKAWVYWPTPPPDNMWNHFVFRDDPMLFDAMINYGYILTDDRLLDVYIHRPAIWAHLLATGRVPPNFTP
jgi:hypothetical protein